MINEVCDCISSKASQFLEFNGSGSTSFLIFLLYEYVAGHMTLDNFSWSDTLIFKYNREKYKRRGTKSDLND